MSDNDDREFFDEPCESCGSTDQVSEDPNGELLCSDCFDDAWL